ncbi:MAG TPA: HlyD family efflux transporter periplasmic adaptor subunit [Magnetospirillum sp.]|jgi:HlyD family secretion protein|nr:HlyD family efflux transporter periplasmic adaptor subunit [Magnetospirillum sp.]
MRRKSPVLLVVVLLAAVAAGALYLALRKPADTGALVLNGSVDIRQVDLAFRVEGRLDKLLVEEGDHVKAGQVVAKVETGYLADAVHIAEARLAGAQANLSKLEAGNRPQEIAQARADVARTEAAFANAKAIYERRSSTSVDSVVSRQALDTARADMRQTEAQLNHAREALALQEKGFRQEDIAVAKAQVESEQGTLDLMRRRLADAELTAPADGQVMTRVREPGAMVLPGATVLTLALTQPMQVRTWVPETALGKVVPGTRAEVTTDSSAKIYHGQVGFVSPVAEFTPKTVETPELRTSLVYRVRVIVSDPDDGLRQGMPVTVRLLP